KALLQAAFSYFPAGAHLNYVFQRHVTRRLPAGDDFFLARASMARRHLDFVNRHSARPLGEMLFYEFGAGPDLCGPLVFHAYGVARQILADVRPLARPQLINATLDKLRRLGPAMELARAPGHGIEPPWSRALSQLRQDYGIEYR